MRVFAVRDESPAQPPQPYLWEWRVYFAIGDFGVRFALIHLFTGVAVTGALLAVNGSPGLLITIAVIAAIVFGALFVVSESSARRVTHAVWPEPGPHPDGDWMPH